MEEPRVTLPDVVLNDNATVATNFADIDPGPFIVAVVELLEAEPKDMIERGEVEDQLEKEYPEEDAAEIETEELALTQVVVEGLVLPPAFGV
jgi:hypothetical protein